MTISRRGFLGGLAAGTGVLLGKSGASAHEHFAGYAGRVGLLHDTTLCIGCRSCEAACSTVNHLPPPAVPLSDPSAFEKKRRTTDKQLTVVNRYVPAGGKKQAVYRKLQCMHCNEPCCASVCFVKAFTKTPEGPVLYNPDVCVGCRYCVMACPYSALGYEYDNPTSPRVMRCTMCYDRIKQNLQPACAEACPTGAIKLNDRGVHYVEAAECNLCEACVPVCPEGVMFVRTALADTAWKCDLCGDCVSACGTDALWVAEERTAAA